MFDFLCPKLSALQNNLTDGELRLARIARITISHTLSARTGRQQEIEVRQVQRDSQKEFLTLKVRLLLLFLNICWWEIDFGKVLNEVYSQAEHKG